MSRPEVGSELHEMEVVEMVDRFQFKDDLPGDDEVDTEAQP
jgi:hypothetical protein